MQETAPSHAKNLGRVSKIGKSQIVSYKHVNAVGCYIVMHKSPYCYYHELTKLDETFALSGKYTKGFIRSRQSATAHITRATLSKL